MARIPFKPNRDFKQRQKEEYLEDDKWSLLFIQQFKRVRENKEKANTIYLNLYTQ